MLRVAISRRSVAALAFAAGLSAAGPSAAGLSAAAPASQTASASEGAPERARGGVLVLGAGSRPGLEVDAAGTGYVAWVGPENTATSLQFCRLPRGASTCASRHAIAVPASTTSGHRPFVSVSGSTVRVLQYRYPFSGSNLAGVYKFTSTDNGVTFAPGVMVGTVPFEEGTVGPGSTFSGVPVNGEMAFQNVALDSGATHDKAVLSATHQNHASVGLLDTGTPLAVFTQNDVAQWRRYDGSGSLNNIANWSATADVGVATYPKLAGGPNGLFLFAGNGNSGLNMRRFTGSGFGAPVSIGPGLSPYKHLTQDAGGRLHAVFQRDNANPLRLIHAVSDDGVSWRSGILVTQDIGSDGGIQDLRVAAAPDHIGFTVWHAGLGVGDVRIAAIGPGAPAGAVSFSASPNSLRVSAEGRFAYHFAVTTAGSGAISLKSTKKVRVGPTLRFIGVAAKRYAKDREGRVLVRLDLSDRSLRALKRVDSLLFKVTVTLDGRAFTTTLRLRKP